MRRSSLACISSRRFYKPIYRTNLTAASLSTLTALVNTQTYFIENVSKKCHVIKSFIFLYR